MKENGNREQNKLNENGKEQQGQTGMESGRQRDTSGQQKETVGKVIFDYIKKEIDRGK